MISSLLGRRPLSLHSSARLAFPAGGTLVIDETLPARWGLLRWGGHQEGGHAQVEVWGTGLPEVPLREPLRRLLAISASGGHLQRALGTLTESGGYELMVLSRPAGEVLADVCHGHRGPLGPERALPVLDAVSRALDTLHAAGLCHLEVRPEHVVLTGAGPVLCGLGQVQAESLVPLPSSPVRKSFSTHETLPQPTLMEVCAYLAPEQIVPERSGLIDRRTDIYALSALSFYLLTGVHPFGEDGEMATLGAHLLAWRPLCTTYRPDLGESVDAVLQRGLSLDPRDRPPSCSELLDDLRAALSEVPLRRALLPAAGGVPTVLVVAGNAAARRELTGIVGAVAPRHPVLADDGGHAESLSRRYRPLLLLLHLPSLPEDEGRSLCRALLSGPGPRPQAVALLSHRQGDMAQELSRLGVTLVPTHSSGGSGPVQASRPLLSLLRRILLAPR